MWQSITCGSLTNQHSPVPPRRARATVPKFGTVARARSGRHSLEGLDAMFWKGACIIRDFSYYVALECSERGYGQEEDYVDLFQRTS